MVVAAAKETHRGVRARRPMGNELGVRFGVGNEGLRPDHVDSGFKSRPNDGFDFGRVLRSRHAAHGAFHTSSRTVRQPRRFGGVRVSDGELRSHVFGGNGATVHRMQHHGGRSAADFGGLDDGRGGRRDFQV